jgi:hypothetical protein
VNPIRPGYDGAVQDDGPLRHYHETKLRSGATPPPPLMSAPLFVSGRDVDTDHAVVIAAVAMTIAMVMIFRISFFSP